MNAVKHVPLSVLMGCFAVILGVGCGEKASKFKEGDTETSPKKDASVDDSDSASDTAPISQDTPCRAFEAFLTECEMGTAGIAYFNTFCEGFDEVFIDSFMLSLMPCMTELGCEGFLEVFESVEAGDAGDTEFNPMEACADDALQGATPEQANTDFMNHVCDYAVECDPSMTEAECEREFTDPDGDMFGFLFLEEKFIKTADACVYPMPSCADVSEAIACIEAANEEVASIFNALM
jgi:hypothetical protein